MKKQTMTMNEIRKAGIEALTKALGPVDMARFIQQFDKGSGNYTEERDAWLGNLTVEEIFETAKKIQEVKRNQKET